MQQRTAEPNNLTQFYCIEESSKNNVKYDTRSRKRWNLNYREASAYLSEGKNNVKFTAYPRDSKSQAAYLIDHSSLFHLLNLFASLGLLGLTLSEPPSVTGFRLPLVVHGLIEIAALFVIFAELVLRWKWLGFRSFITHTRTMLKLVLVITMSVEAITVLIRQSSHVRVTRALRPLFLLDSFYCRSARRFIRQLIQSLSAVIHILVLIIFTLVMFSMLGFFLFSKNPNDLYFQSFTDSFISLFILMTTANYPDVMMPSYKKSKWSSIFFVIYISIEIFIFMNLLLAVVYSAFLKNKKEKFRKLILHKRYACGLALKQLVSETDPDGITFQHFAGFMKHYKPRMNVKEAYLVFKALNASGSGKLSLYEFMNVYDYSKLSWKEVEPPNKAIKNIYLRRLQSVAEKIVSNKWFDYAIYAVILANFVWVVLDVIRMSTLKYAKPESPILWVKTFSNLKRVSLSFVFIYVVEAAMKMIGFGVKQYFLSGWNVFDFWVTLTSLAAELLQLVDKRFFILVILRPIRILRFFKLEKNCRELLGSLFMILPKMANLAVVMLILYYFFAIIGMEIFAPFTDKLMNCCANTSVQQYYMYENSTNADGFYYLNNFENLLTSGITLFELTVINNWWLIMEGYANVVSPWTRLYFMIFFLVNMMVMAVVVAFVLETLLFRNECQLDIKENRFHRIDITLTSDEIATILQMKGVQIDKVTRNSLPQEEKRYEGCRKLKESDFNVKMYSSNITEWLAEETL